MTAQVQLRSRPDSSARTGRRSITVVLAMASRAADEHSTCMRIRSRNLIDDPSDVDIASRGRELVIPDVVCVSVSQLTVEVVTPAFQVSSKAERAGVAAL